MRIVFLAIGDELLRGESREGNGAVLAEALAARGFVLAEIRVVADDFGAIAGALRELTAEPTLVVCSGGLGPTDDDFTRAAVAKALGVALLRDAQVLASLQARYDGLGRTMHATNARQADFPQGAEVLVNAHGTAPAFALAVAGGLVACLPGVPAEFRALIRDHLDNLLLQVQLTPILRNEITLRLFGIPESDMQGVLTGLPHYRAATMRSLPTFPEIRLKLASCDDINDFNVLLDEVRAALTWRIYSERDDDSHAAAVLRALLAKECTVAIAESCTGGLIGHLLTEVPGASRCLIAAAVVYANSAKHILLGVPQETLDEFGAVSEQTARAMAQGVRERCGATFGVATTGIAGPDGGTAAKPVGLVYVAVASENGCRVRALRMGAIGRSRFKLLVAHTALADLRRAAG